MIAHQRLTSTGRVVGDQQVLGRVDRDQRDESVLLPGNDGKTDEVVDRRRPDGVDEFIPGDGNPETECLDECVKRVPRSEPLAGNLAPSRIVHEAGAGANRLPEAGFAVTCSAQSVAELGDQRVTDVRPKHDLTVGIGSVAFKAQRYQPTGTEPEAKGQDGAHHHDGLSPCTLSDGLPLDEWKSITYSLPWSTWQPVRGRWKSTMVSLQ